MVICEQQENIFGHMHEFWNPVKIVQDRTYNLMSYKNHSVVGLVIFIVLSCLQTLVKLETRAYEILHKIFGGQL